MISKHDNLREELGKILHLLDLFTANVDEDLQYKKYLVCEAKEALKSLLEKTDVSES